MSQAVESTRAPEPVGLYPHARRVGNLLFLSGIGPRVRGSKVIPGVTLGPDGTVVDHDIEVQARSVFANVRAVLEDAGARWEDLVDVTVYLTDMARDFPTYNRLWAEHFPDPATRPCRTTLEINCLPTPIAIELKCVAELRSSSGMVSGSGSGSASSSGSGSGSSSGSGSGLSSGHGRSLQPIDFQRWIDEHRHLLRPPVGNAVVWEDTEFTVMVVGGPNSRTDFHVNQGEEFFYQLEGDVVLRLLEGGRKVDVPLRQGQIFLLPPGVPHSPQRPADTVGLVIERRRRPEEIDTFLWVCDRCGHELYRESMHLTDIVAQLPPVFGRYWGDPAHTTCQACGHLHVRPPKT